MDINVDEYVESFKVQMMDVVYAWSTGSTFADICKMTDVFEGKINCQLRLIISYIKIPTLQIFCHTYPLKIATFFYSDFY